MREAEQFEYLLDTTYQAAMGETDWKKTIVTINHLFDSTAGGFFIQDENEGSSDRIMMQGFAEGAMDLYEKHYSKNNPWFTIPGMMDPNYIRTEEDIDRYYKDRKTFRSTEMFNDWMIPQEFTHAIGGCLTTRGSLHLNFTMFRPDCAGAYSALEVTLLRKLAPHLRRSLEVSSIFSQSKAKENMLLVGMDKIGFGVVILDEFQKISELNAEAESVLNAGDGLSIVTKKIYVDDKNSRTQFEHVLSSCRKLLLEPHCRATDWLYIKRKSKNPEYQIMLVQNRESLSLLCGSEVKSMLLIVDPIRRTKLPRKKLQSRYLFTDRETDVAQLLLDGKAAKEIAQNLEMTYESSRWYIKQICQKVGVRKKTEFVAKVLGELSLIV